MNGMNIESLSVQSEADIPHRIFTLQHAMSPYRLLKASMLQDLELKRRTEIEYINGVVSLLAEGAGISIPFNDLVVKLVKQAEQALSIPEFDTNIQLFEDLMKKESLVKYGQ